MIVYVLMGMAAYVLAVVLLAVMPWLVEQDREAQRWRTRALRARWIITPMASWREDAEADLLRSVAAELATESFRVCISYAVRPVNPDYFGIATVGWNEAPL